MSTFEVLVSRVCLPTTGKQGKVGLLMLCLMLTMGRLLLACICLGLAAPATAQWKVFTETRTVQAKNKPFVCKYELMYKGSLTVDSKKSKVTCKPDSKGKFGTVSQTFDIRDKSVEVVHEIKKGKDKIKEIKISKLTTPAPTTAAPTTASPTPAPSPPLFSTSTWPNTGVSTSPFPGTLPSSTSNCSCGQAVRGTRIVNGEETEVNEFPWMGGLVGAGGDRVWCGATLIASMWVMTAAHCTESSDPRDIEVLLGEHDYYDDTETVSLRAKVADIFNHPGYDSDSIDNDFSLLRLAEHVDFDSFPHIRPACLPQDPAEDYTGFLATVSGWGTTSSGGQASHFLQKAEVTVLSNEDCNGPSYAYGGAVTDLMMCANVQGGGTDSCQGDSGGPLVTPNPDFYELIGVVSWGYGCAQADAPGVYARMTKALQWIARTTAGSWMTCSRCEDPTNCPTMPSPSLPPVSTSPWTQTSPYQNYTGNPDNCCRYEDQCLPLDTRHARPEKCDWVYCWDHGAGPTLSVYSEYDAMGCCMGDEVMYLDGDEKMDNAGNTLTCCKGRWMEPAREEFDGEQPILID